METVIGFAVFSVLVAVCWGVLTLRDAAISSTVGAVNRRVNHRKHTIGVDMARSTFFYGIEGTSDQLVEVLKEGVMCAAGTPATADATSLITPRLHVMSVDEESIGWRYKSRTRDGFTAIARVATAEFADGSSHAGVVLGFPEVHTLDGVVADVDAMTVLRHDVLAALRSIDPEVVERMT